MTTLILWIFASVTNIAHAQEYRIFGGLDAGPLYVSSSSRTENDKTGWHVGLKMLGSTEISNYVLDGGLGWQYEALSAVSGARADIKMRSVFLEFSPRYKMDAWQAGMAISLGFGTDHTYTSNIEKSNAIIYVGPQVVYEIPDTDKKLFYRFLGRIMTDLTVQNQQYYSGQLGFQIGFSSSDLFSTRTD